MFAPHPERWRLEPDGDPVVTHSSLLLPVRRDDGVPAMLEVAVEAEERRGGLLTAWWGGDGDDPVLDLAVAELAAGELDGF